jgi:Phage portal protein
LSKQKKRKQAMIERAGIPTGGNIISPAAIQAIIAQMTRPGKPSDGTDAFSPGTSMEPQASVNPKGLPQLFQYPLAMNTLYPDRTLGNPEIPAFQQLRNLAQLCDGIALCEKVWLDLIPKLTIKIQLRPDLEEGGANLKDFQKEVSAYTKFFEKPDGINDFHSWLRIAIIEQTQIDALCIYKQRDKAGRLLKLPIVAGETMKPLLDDWGAVVAYQQFPWGIPGKVYSTDEMIYFRESPQANTPYGRSRVERVMLRVNQALRKENKDLKYFTDGNQPFAIMEVPEASNWTPDQIDAFEQMWNALTAGSQQQQVRMKFTQPGMKYTPLEQYQLICDFDKFLLNYFAADYGLSMADLSFTESIHKSSDEGQQNMLFRRTLFPLTVMYGMICTNILCNDFHDDRFVFGFGGYEEVEDLQSLSAAYGSFIDNGVISPSDVAHLMKFPDIPQTGPLLVTKSGITPLASFEIGSESRKAQDDALLAGLKMAANPQQQQPQDDDEEEQSSNGTSTPQAKDKQAGTGKGTQVASKTKQTTEKRYTVSELLQLLSQQEQAEASSQDDGTSIERSQEERATVKRDEDTDDHANGGSTIDTSHAPHDASPDYRKWRSRAIDDVKAGRTQRDFTTTLIPQRTHKQISDELVECSTVDEVRAVFNRAKVMESEPIIASKEELAKSVYSVFSKVAQRGHSELAALESE